MATNELQQHQRELIELSMSAGALKFGSFVLKSGRTSPYFFNAGLLSTGPLISAVATGYAALIAQQGIEFDVLFGPAYKGIPFVAATTLLLHRDHGISVGYAYDRKEAKDHGEGGRMVGADIKGKRVLILDDVMTAGTAIRSSIDLIRKEGGIVAGVVMLFDREEVTVEGRNTVDDVEEIIGGGAKATTILRMRDLVTWLEDNGRTEDVEVMRGYLNQYGVKS
ncbi:hypothetical protein M0805_002796 [Coniferiporia weirii]|nr:hypothetical protein M0805_002796 [Coniferiporia weirii]